MSVATERKSLRDALTGYPLMKVNELATFLRCSEEHVRDLLKTGVIPSTNIGLGQRAEYRVDPLDAAVFHLAQREGISTEDYWERHGEATAEHAQRLVTRILKLVAA